MSDGFPGKPKILRGAFVEYGLSAPPLMVVFQYNPVQLVRTRKLTFAAGSAPPETSLRDFHREYADLLELRKDQVVKVSEQTIAFDIRLDATDRLDDGDPAAEQFGIAPQIAALELMSVPKEEGELNSLVAKLGTVPGFSYQEAPKPPMVLFVFGRKRVLPVNIDSMVVTETEFSAALDPVRAMVAVSLTVIEGQSLPYRYTRATSEAMALLNLAGLTAATDVAIPG